MYYGARYYDPRTSVWQSPDPILDDYLDGEPNGGVYNSYNHNLYAYTYQNPVKYIDPDGTSIWIPLDGGSASKFIQDVNSRGGKITGNDFSVKTVGGVDYAVFKNPKAIGRAKSLKYVRQAVGDNDKHLVIYTNKGKVSASATIDGENANADIELTEKGTNMNFDSKRWSHIKDFKLTKNGKPGGITPNSFTVINSDLPSRTTKKSHGDKKGSRADRSEILGHEFGHAVDDKDKKRLGIGHQDLFNETSGAARKEDKQTYDSLAPTDEY